jgi:hypothetical protein
MQKPVKRRWIFYFVPVLLTGIVVENGESAFKDKTNEYL